MIDAEELPPIELACSLTGQVYYQSYFYCMQIIEKNILERDEPHNIPLTAMCAGYIAGVRHERKRQRQKATAGNIKEAQKEKPLSDADARRQALKILANDEQQSL